MNADSNPIRRDRVRDARLVTFAVAIVLLLLTCLILIATRPVFGDFFASLGTSLPPMTELTLSIPGWLVIGIAGSVSVVLGAIHYRTRRAGVGFAANMAAISVSLVVGGLMLTSLLLPLRAFVKSLG